MPRDGVVEPHLRQPLHRAELHLGYERLLDVLVCVQEVDCVTEMIPPRSAFSAAEHHLLGELNLLDNPKTSEVVSIQQLADAHPRVVVVRERRPVVPISLGRVGGGENGVVDGYDELAPEEIENLDRLAAVRRVWTQPGDYALRGAVDVGHADDLFITLLDVRLVDTDGVDPHGAWAVAVAKMSEGRCKTLSDGEC